MRTVVLCAALTGCAIIKPDFYETMPTAQICHGLYSLPPWNLNHPARFRELERRGASCGHPGEIAAAQRGAEQQLGNTITTIDAITRQTAPHTYTYILNGQRVTCTTVNNVTNCR
jgi:hypothetical protein